MTVEHHEHPEMVTELNGYGERLNRAEVCMAEVRTKVERGEVDVSKLFSLVADNAKQLGAAERALAGLSGRVAGAVAVITTLVTIVMKIAEHFITK